MGDKVEYYMEQMIPELEELQTSGIFSRDEVREIIKKRKNFEYGVARAGKEKVDFLRYIEYELNLDLLRRKRVERLNIKTKTGHAVIRRITNLFTRALKKFRGDIRLWIQFIDFNMRMGSYKNLNRTFAEALSAHPLHTPLWILAASWEFEHNQNMGAARTLLQRALRLVPKSQQLYLEYCRLEMLYREKIEKRMEVFGIDKSALTPNTEDAINQEDLPDAPSDEEKEDDGFIELNTPADPAKKAKAGSSNPFFEGTIARIIFHEAVKVFPTDFALRRRFLDVLQSFPETDHIQNEIYESLEADFEDSVDVADILARKPLDRIVNVTKMDASGLFNVVKECIDIFDTTTTRINTPELYQRFLQFIEEQMENIDDEDIVSLLRAKHNQVFNEAFKAKNVNAEMVLGRLESLLKGSNIKGALEFAEKAVQILPEDADVALARVELLVRIKQVEMFATHKEYSKLLPSDEHLESCFKQAVKVGLAKLGALSKSKNELERVKYDSQNCWKIFTYYMEFLVNKNTAADVLVAKFAEIGSKLKGMQLERYRRETVAIASASAKLTAESVRKLYKKAFEYPPATLEFYQQCIEVEEKLLKPDQPTIRNLFEMAIRDFGEKNTDLWIQYVKWEAAVGQLGKSTGLYWRAKKQLNDPDEFVAKHAEMISNMDTQ